MKILIVDDDRNLRTMLTSELMAEGHEPSQAENGAAALEMLDADEYDVVLLDMNMPGIKGMEVLKKIRSDGLPCEVIVLTGHASVPAAVDAMKHGACDYLTKPFSLSSLNASIIRAYEKKKLLSENIALKTQIKRQGALNPVITGSSLMKDLFENAKKVAQADFPVLIYGESGVGKELLARYLHESSQRGEGPFIAINCGAIPENMIESELFGYEKGAFTGASGRKQGLMEIADGGTLFLDEIGELPLQLQVKLLRAVETKKFMRLGGVREVSTDVRFISATNRDLKNEAERLNFRPDLYYRISAITLHIPPLRERKEDIPLLVEHFIKSYMTVKNKKFTSDAMKSLMEYAWPGNVRELQNVIQRTLLLSHDDVIDVGDLPADVISARPPVYRRLQDVEREHILRIFRETGGQRGKTSEILGIDPKTLYRKLQAYGISE